MLLFVGWLSKKKKIENLTTPSFPLYQLPSLYMLSSFCDEGRKVEASFLPSTFAYTKQSSCPRSASQVSPGSEHLTLLGGPVPCLLTSPPHVASQAALWCCWTVSRNAGPAMIPCGDTVCHSSCPPPHFCFSQLSGLRAISLLCHMHLCTASPTPSSECRTAPLSLQLTSASPVSPKSR